MNEIILNGLLNLFAIFTSLAKVDPERARSAVILYLSSYFGIRSNKEYIELYDEALSMYSDPDFVIDKERVILSVCTQLKPKLIVEEQLLLLLRFMEFAYNNDSDGFTSNLELFRQIADIFGIEPEIYADIFAFVTGKPAECILTIGANEAEAANHIVRKGLEGEIRVLLLQKYNRVIFVYHGNGTVFMNDIPVTRDVFYSWQRSSVIKSPLFQPVYYSEVLTVFNKDKQKDRIILSGRDINFRFPKSENGLHNFSFNLEDGQLVAIMGGSGVGKSTLLGILNGNIIPQEGSVTLNGHSIQTNESKRLIGFVPQDDLLINELTVYQNLWYTARLCFAYLNEEEITQRVESILYDLDLFKIRDLEVGSPIRKTISGGQRKRLNIALELIREPAILYLDEPTSGLSSSDSEKVMILLKEQTQRGRLVVVNIHQPSSEIYKLFDRLWLLDTGGYPIYDGNPIEAITYFKRIANYTDQEVSVCSTCGNINPELILNIIDAKLIDDSGNETNIRKLSPREWHDLYILSRRPFQKIKKIPLPTNIQQKPSLWKQFCIFLERNVQTKLTNKQYLCIALLEAPLLALIVALLTRFAPDEGYSLLNNKNLVSYIFMAVIVATFTGMSMSAEEIIKDRTLLKRERFLRLSRGSYLSSKVFYLLCVSALQSLLFILVGNTLIGIGKEMFLTWWAVLWLISFLANLTGLILSQTLSSVVAIYITIPLLLIPQILLCGLVVPFDDLSKKAANRNTVPLIGNLIPSRWAFEVLVVEQFSANAYNDHFYAIEREKSLAQYYGNVHLMEVRNWVNLIAESNEDNDDRLKTILNELPVLGQAARIEPYVAGTDFNLYLEKAEKALNTRADNFTALLNKRQKELIEEYGSDWLVALKREHHNGAIEDLVLNTSAMRFYKEANHRIYPKIGQAYLYPDNNWGNAPFYSHDKKVWGLTFPTFIYNLLILGFFALLVIIAIFAEFPGRYMDRGNDY